MKAKEVLGKMAKRRAMVMNGSFTLKYRRLDSLIIWIDGSLTSGDQDNGVGVVGSECISSWALLKAFPSDSDMQGSTDINEPLQIDD